MKYLHAGQLTYHDFAKLREAREKRQQQSRKSQRNINTSTYSVRLHPRNNHSNICTRHFNSNYDSLVKSMTITKHLRNPTNVNIDHNHLLTSAQSFYTKIPSSFNANAPFTTIRLKHLERIANQNPSNPTLQYDFLSELLQHYPEAVIERFELYPEFAIDDRCALLYLAALQRDEMNTKINSSADLDSSGIHNFHLGNFMKRLTFQNSENVWIEPTKLAMLHELNKNVLDKKEKKKGSNLAIKVHQILTGQDVATGAAAFGASSLGSIGSGINNAFGGAGGSLRGSDPKFPLHVQMHSPTSGRMALFTLARQVLIAFVVVSALTAVLDEKGMGRAMGMNSKHIQEAEGSDVRFDDVKGVDEAKAELEEIVLYLKNPERFTRLGGKLPRGLLLTGPPGTGKTLLAKAIAGEAGVPFFFSSGSQFEEVYVGLGAKRVRELFEAAKKKAPAIIFIDEIDAVGGTRKLKDQSALKMTLNELLVQLDGFDENNGIIVIGATNFADSLDEALLRPGRFDKHVSVPLPDVGGRKEILEVYAKKTKLAKDVDLNILARGTTGFSGADLYNLMNQAALKASIDGLNSITMSVLEYAKDKIMMGAERKTAVITPKTAKCTAYHEAGHALVAALTDGASPIHKATIMPRGSALGMVMMLPDGDQTSQSYKEMMAFMDVAMGGRVAEELIFGEENVTSGAMSDIANATKIARAMVTKYGFSEEVGIVYHGGNTGEETASVETRAKIDAEVKRLTEGSYNRAKSLLKKHGKEHHLLAETLLEYETLSGEEVLDLIKKGQKPNRPIMNKDNGARGDVSVLEKGKGSSSSASPIPDLGDKVGSRRDAKEH